MKQQDAYIKLNEHVMKEFKENTFVIECVKDLYKLSKEHILYVINFALGKSQEGYRQYEIEILFTIFDENQLLLAKIACLLCICIDNPKQSIIISVNERDISDLFNLEMSKPKDSFLFFREPVGYTTNRLYHFVSFFYQPLKECYTFSKCKFEDFVPTKRILLGRGSFGRVWQENYKDIDFALKIINSGSETSIRRETSCQLGLMHPNCLKLYNYFEYNDKFCLVLELGDTSLEKVCLGGVDKLHLTNTQKKAILLGIGDGLQYLHNHDYLHRDLKGRNIMLRKYGDGYVPLIGDYGLARHMDMEMTMNVGTPSTMAPEVIISNTYSLEADIYSFGCIINELISETKLYAGYNMTWGKLRSDAENCQFRGPPIPSTIPKEVKTLLLACYQEKSKRPSLSSILKTIQSWDETKW